MGLPIPATRALSAFVCTFCGIFKVFKNKTLSLNPLPLTAMTRSMVLKFFSHRKHLARLVFGLTAVWNSLQVGHRKRKKLSLIFVGICNSLISISTGMLFLRSNNSRDENLALIKHLFFCFQDALFISPASTACHLPLKQTTGSIVWLYPFNYQWVISIMPLKIKIGLLCLYPYKLQQVILTMCLEITNRLVEGKQAIYHGYPDAPERTWRVT